MGAVLDWTPASLDYGLYRPGYPGHVFDLLEALGIGRAGQSIADLGAGTGHLAVPFARRGAVVTAVDASAGQLDQARDRAAAEGLSLRLLHARAEDAPLGEGAFDAVTASMCWGYFDEARVVPLVHRALRPSGLLLHASILWTADGGPIAARTAEVLQRHAPGFEGRGGPPAAPVIPRWAEGPFRLRTWHRQATALRFSREGWRGRQRASKWIGAALPAAAVAAFDRELAAVLEAHAPPAFEIAHAVVLQVFERVG